MRYLILVPQKRSDGRTVYASRYDNQLPRRPPGDCGGPWWWAINLTGEVPQEEVRGFVAYYPRWAGHYPENWLDYEGNLRGKDGRVIFPAGAPNSTQGKAWE